MIAGFFARTVAMKFVVWGAVAAILALPLVGWGGYQIGGLVERKSRDAWWKEQIATKSSGVREQVAAGDSAAELTDEQVLEGLGDEDEKMEANEKELAELRETARRNATGPSNDPEPDACPMVPARCVAR